MAANPIPTSAKAPSQPVQVNLYEAKTQLSSLVERAAKGEEIVIAKAGKPMARLVALVRLRPEACCASSAKTCLALPISPTISTLRLPEDVLKDFGLMRR